MLCFYVLCMCLFWLLCYTCVIGVVCLVGIAYFSYGEVVKPTYTMIHIYISVFYRKKERTIHTFYQSNYYLMEIIAGCISIYQL